jgi:AraC-like DNA-binding protein
VVLEAKRMLVHTNNSIKEIGFELGLMSQRILSNIFENAKQRLQLNLENYLTKNSDAVTHNFLRLYKPRTAFRNLSYDMQQRKVYVHLLEVVKDKDYFVIIDYEIGSHR